MTRYVAVFCLSISSWTGGVIFREIDTDGLTWTLGVSITLFAVLSLVLGNRIGKGHYLASDCAKRIQAMPSTPCPVCQPGSGGPGLGNTSSSES